ncbi:uncharacterized protein LOC131045236 isoform X2 [Cryptomeria japonica]|uniref:uncharacterized protein LOC131045236 isoform X2 n=1 Tax=Cryptomeria japonica TaxID=3369 RepID=UPI0025AC16CC|nr:uncharacterized protein LOC131045236 isoform X2 [Cryptomeria japonica]
MTLLLLVLIFTDGCRCVESYSQFSKRENTQKPEAWRKNKGMKYLFPDTRLHDLTLQSVTPPLLPQCRCYFHPSFSLNLHLKLLFKETSSLNTLQFNITVPTPYIFTTRGGS